MYTNFASIAFHRAFLQNFVDSQQRRELENRGMLNMTAFTWQNPSGVNSVNTTPKVESTRRQEVAKQLKVVVSEN